MKRYRLDIKDWEAFDSLARLQNFGLAAGELGVTQSAISQRLTKLEADLQLRLLTRSNRGVTLTEDGAALLPEARALITAKRNALEAAAAIRQNGPRPMRMILSNAIIHTPLLSHLKQVLNGLSDLDSQVDVTGADEIESRMLTGDCDIAITTLPMVRDGFEHALLTTLPMGVAVPDGYVGDSVSIDDLAAHPLMMAPREIDPGLFDPLVVAATRAGRALNVGRAVIGFPAIMAMVAIGKGWGIVPEAMAGAAPQGARVVPLDVPTPPSIRVLMIWKVENTRPAKAVGALQNHHWE